MGNSKSVPSETLKKPESVGGEGLKFIFCCCCFGVGSLFCFETGSCCVAQANLEL